MSKDQIFENLAQAWLDGDHYKWRAMRAAGVNEAYCTGDAPDREKFQKWAETVPQTLRNPLYHWTHLELKRPFGISDRLLNPDTAKVSRPPVVVPGLQIKPADQVREWTLANAGARPADRDPVDTRVIGQVRARNGSIIKSQDDVGGWPDLAANRRELAIPDNPSGDDNGDGYTNLEEWLHKFAAAVEGAKR